MGWRGRELAWSMGRGGGGDGGGGVGGGGGGGAVAALGLQVGASSAGPEPGVPNAPPPARRRDSGLSGPRAAARPSAASPPPPPAGKATGRVLPRGGGPGQSGPAGSGNCGAAPAILLPSSGPTPSERGTAHGATAGRRRPAPLEARDPRRVRGRRRTGRGPARAARRPPGFSRRVPGLVARRRLVHRARSVRRDPPSGTRVTPIRPPRRRAPALAGSREGTLGRSGPARGLASAARSCPGSPCAVAAAEGAEAKFRRARPGGPVPSAGRAEFVVALRQEGLCSCRDDAMPAASDRRSALVLGANTARLSVLASRYAGIKMTCMPRGGARPAQAMHRL